MDITDKAFSLEDLHIYGSSVESIVRFGLLLLSFLICFVFVDNSSDLTILAGSFLLFFMPLGIDYCIRARSQPKRYIVNKVILSSIMILIIIADSFSIAAMRSGNSIVISGLYIFAIVIIFVNGIDALAFFISEPKVSQSDESQFEQVRVDMYIKKGDINFFDKK